MCSGQSSPEGVAKLGPDFVERHEEVLAFLRRPAGLDDDITITIARQKGSGDKPQCFVCVRVRDTIICKEVPCGGLPLPTWPKEPTRPGPGI
jgi:hypothetical protein